MLARNIEAAEMAAADMIGRQPLGGSVSGSPHTYHIGFNIYDAMHDMTYFIIRAFSSPASLTGSISRRCGILAESRLLILSNAAKLHSWAAL